MMEEQEELPAPEAEQQPAEETEQTSQQEAEESAPSHREQERSAPFEEIPNRRVTSDTTTRRIDFNNLKFGSNYE